MAKYCINCGKSVPDKAKFCPICGENQQMEESKPVEETKAPLQRRVNDPADSLSSANLSLNYTLLDNDSSFHGYRIIKMINKDVEGIKYAVEKDNHQYLLKIFYKSSLSNVHTLFSLQKRLEKLHHVKDKHIARVVKVDPHHDPAYMVVDYIHGVSLASIKANNPEKLTEEFVRLIAPQLISTAIVIRKEELTYGSLSLTNIMVDDEGNTTILSSALTYEKRDEREDLFAIASVLAQALSHHTMYRSIYSQERLLAQKFVYIAGVSLSFNKTLAEALHRNILQRYLRLEDFLEAVINLPPISEDEICSVLEKTIPDKLEDVSASDKPKTHIEFGFWFLIILIISLLIALLTTNIFSVLFGGKGDTLQYTGIIKQSTERDSLGNPSQPKDVQSVTPMRTAYGDLKANTGTTRPDFRLQLPTPNQNNGSSAPVVSKPKPPSNMVYIDANTLGFGRLKDNLHHNVSLSSFYIGKTEVTQGEWSQLMKPANCSTFGDKLPVDNVSWFDIAIYCNGRSEAESLTPAYKIRGVGASRVVTCDFKANGYRLPTEAEWELAAKAGQLYNYSGSDDPQDVSWYQSNSGGKIHYPGGKDANSYGLFDMTGNVAEWCWDWYDANYIRALPTFINPNGPETGTLKVIRGGSIVNGEGRNLNILWREKGDPNNGYQFVGFRLVRSY